MPNPEYLASVKRLRAAGALKTGPRRQPRQGRTDPIPEADRLLEYRARGLRVEKPLNFEGERK